MNNIYLKELAEKFEKSQEEKSKAYFGYFRSISTLSVALIGLLIGLKVSLLSGSRLQRGSTSF